MEGEESTIDVGRLFGNRRSNELSEKLQDHILKFHGLLKVNYVTALLDYYEARVRNSSVDVLGLLPRNQSIFATGND